MALRDHGRVPPEGGQGQRPPVGQKPLHVVLQVGDGAGAATLTDHVGFEVALEGLSKSGAARPPPFFGWMLAAGDLAQPLLGLCSGLARVDLPGLAHRKPYRLAKAIPPEVSLDRVGLLGLAHEDEETAQIRVAGEVLAFGCERERRYGLVGQRDAEVCHGSVLRRGPDGVLRVCRSRWRGPQEIYAFESARQQILAPDSDTR